MGFNMRRYRYMDLSSKIKAAQEKWGVYTSGQDFEKSNRATGEIVTKDPNSLKEAVDKAASGANVTASSNPYYSPNTPIQDFWAGVEDKVNEVLAKSKYVPPPPSPSPNPGTTPTPPTPSPGGGGGGCGNKCFGSKC